MAMIDLNIRGTAEHKLLSKAEKRAHLIQFSYGSMGSYVHVHSPTVKSSATLSVQIVTVTHWQFSMSKGHVSGQIYHRIDTMSSQKLACDADMKSLHRR